ncbi:MAG TPA: DUF924 family protein [Gammaproteobacteria bacterium]
MRSGIPPADAEALLAFWFDPAHRPLWFRATPEFDAELGERFLATWEAARDDALHAWEATPRGALALVIVLDQLPLNMFRGQPESFATEAAARAVAARAIARGFDAALDDAGRAFLYLPWMHSETLADQDRAVALYAAAGLADNLKWAEHHREIVRRFGRFPHRNAILGRDSTAAEQAWLASPDAYGG